MTTPQQPNNTSHNIAAAYNRATEIFDAAQQAINAEREAEAARLIGDDAAPQQPAPAELAKAIADRVRANDGPDPRWLCTQESLTDVFEMQKTLDFSSDEVVDAIGLLLDHVAAFTQQHAADLEARDKRIAELQQRLLTAAGDDLCRLTQEEIKDLTAGQVKIPPKEEFLSSCERFHAQIATESGVLENCLTLAQLIAENEQYRIDLEARDLRIDTLTSERNRRQSDLEAMQCEMINHRSRAEILNKRLFELREQLTAAQAERDEAARLLRLSAAHALGYDTGDKSLEFLSSRQSSELADMSIAIEMHVNSLTARLTAYEKLEAAVQDADCSESALGVYARGIQSALKEIEATK